MQITTTQIKSAAKVLGILVLGGILALAGNAAFTTVKSYVQMQTGMAEVVGLLNYNLQVGTLKLPPKAVPAAPQQPPAAQPSPATEVPPPPAPAKP